MGLVSCVLILLAKPHHLVPLFILAVASLGMHIPVLLMNVGHKISRYVSLCILIPDSRGRAHGRPFEMDRVRGVHSSANQLGLTLAHTVVWLGK